MTTLCYKTSENILSAFYRLRNAGYINVVAQPSILQEEKRPMIDYACWRLAREDLLLLIESGFLTDNSLSLAEIAESHSYN